jgi:hypothetical protein
VEIRDGIHQLVKIVIMEIQLIQLSMMAVQINVNGMKAGFVMVNNLLCRYVRQCVEMEKLKVLKHAMIKI